MLGTCPFCNSEQYRKTDEDTVEELMKQVEVNDAGAMYALGNHHYNGNVGLQQDWEKAHELWTQAAALGSSQAHCHMGNEYNKGGDLKKAKFYTKAAAMAGHDGARNNLGTMEANSGNMERAVKHWIIAASAGNHKARKCPTIKVWLVEIQWTHFDRIQ
jgi:TPR repeat protein